MVKQIILLLGLGTLSMTSASATNLEIALRNGDVCELSDGYIQAKPGKEGDMSGLVAEVNSKRARVYSDIAARQGLDPASVAMEMAGEQKAQNPAIFCK